MDLNWLNNLELLDYNLPSEVIAQHPVSPRDQSKLLHYRSGEISAFQFTNLPDLMPDDAVLVFNETKVIHARLFFSASTGAKIEIFCLDPHYPSLHLDNLLEKNEVIWKCLVGNNKRWKNDVISTEVNIQGELITLNAERIQRVDDSFLIRFFWESSAGIAFGDLLEEIGQIPIPPYLNREVEIEDDTDYQTVYAKAEGSVAAPTAGLHFTEAVLEKLANKGVTFVFVTLHVGAGTFKPIKSENIAEHIMHQEQIKISKKSLEMLLEAGRSQKPIIAVGTTSLRTMESVYWYGNNLLDSSSNTLSVSQWEPYTTREAFSLEISLGNILKMMNLNGLSWLHGETKLMIVPGYTFQVFSAIITNFHQPKSTLLLLISAFVGNDWKKIYEFALLNRFRFLSFGDSSLLWKK